MVEWGEEKFPAPTRRGDGGQWGGHSSLNGVPGHLESMGSHWRAVLGILEWGHLSGSYFLTSPVPTLLSAGPKALLCLGKGL